MKIGVHGTRLIKSVGRTTAALAVMFMVIGTSSFAGDVSAQPANTLNITGSPAGVLPQQATETGWLKDFHVTGFVSQTFGFARSGAVAAGAIFLVLALAAQSTAGDVSGEHTGIERRT